MERLTELLTELLNGVSDSYYDFVVGVLNYAKLKKSNMDAIIEYIENHPQADTSEILEYMISRDDYYDHAQRIAGVSSRLQRQA